MKWREFLTILIVGLFIESAWILCTYFFSKASDFGDMLILQAVTAPYFIGLFLWRAR